MRFAARAEAAAIQRVLLLMLEILLGVRLKCEVTEATPRD
jgi:hypothetical protein